jgi:arthrofactin-type cyclic lipopeptide synthetase C
VPRAGNTAISFVELDNNLGTLAPIETQQPRGLDGTLVPHATVLAAARMYLQYVKQKYPRQSAHLAGHSFGGWIAFEMAQLLRAAGHTVASLTILDCDAPDGDNMLGREYSRTEVVMELVETYEQFAQRPLEIGCRRWAPNLTVWRSPGNHMTLLRQPNVTALSNWLSSIFSPTES